MMARRVEEYRVKVNGSSLQVFRLGVYVGSVGLKELCQMVGVKRRDGTNPIVVQPGFIKKGGLEGGFGTKEGLGLPEPAREA